MSNGHVTGPVSNLGTTARHGTHLTFWLDREYLGEDGKLPAINTDFAHILLAEADRPEARLTVLDRRESSATANRPS
jgi:hypothetical protein